MCACMHVLCICVSCTFSMFLFCVFPFLISLFALFYSDCLFFIGLFVPKKERKKVWN